MHEERIGVAYMKGIWGRQDTDEVEISPFKYNHARNWIRVVCYILLYKFDKYMWFYRSSPSTLAVHAGAYLSIFLGVILERVT